MSEAIISIADVLEGKDCKGKIVDMGFWFDIPYITKKVLKILYDKGVAGVRFVIEHDLMKELLHAQKTLNFPIFAT